ncbi:MAG: response regulator [Chitinophagales bacterium]|nr:response regulator [Chitinophagales bacterium]
MFTCIIIDDELHCRERLLALLESNGSFEIEGVATNVKEGIKLLDNITPDILFLDVEMPEGTGFDVLERKKNELKNTKVIFTTAYDKYAVKAIKNSAFDYLLKPINEEALNEVLLKLNQNEQVHTKQIDNLIDSLHSKKFEKLVINTVNSFEIINKEEIVLCESDTSYSYIVLDNNSKIITSINMKKLNELIDNPNFFRVHNSYIINLYKIKSVDKKGEIIMNNGSIVPISRRKKDEFYKKIGIL